jgi:hypothetical protein
MSKTNQVLESYTETGIHRNTSLFKIRENIMSKMAFSSVEFLFVSLREIQ